MRLYVIGPVTGRENLNRSAFEEAKEKLWDAGYDVVIPHDVVPPDYDYARAMRTSIVTMLGCDGAAFLPDWDESRGAKLEREVAIAGGLPIHCVGTWLLMADDDLASTISPEETQNPPSDGVLAPSNEVLGVLISRMNETNALLRAMFSQLKAVTALSNVHTLESYEGRKDMTDRAGLYAMEAQACFEAAGKEAE